MGKQYRINPDTGVFEHRNTGIFGPSEWYPDYDRNGDTHRINPDTGVKEHQHHGLFGPSEWYPDEDD